jgi:ankyrin repeat protein
VTPIRAIDTAALERLLVLIANMLKLSLNTSQRTGKVHFGLNHETRSHTIRLITIACLRYLYYSEMEARRHDVKLALKDTCAWILGHEIFEKWSTRKNGLLWISGHPGTGKSTLLKYVLQKMSQERPVLQAETLVLSHFFHGRGSEIQKSLFGFFRSILHQLLSKAPARLVKLLEAFKNNCEEKGKPGEKWDWHLEELRDLLHSSLLAVLEAHAILTFVDAVDECGQAVAHQLVGEFEDILNLSSEIRQSTFRICFTCRHFPIIRLNKGLEICVEKENGKDIITYVDMRLPREKDPIKHMIIQRASGTFQWVRLVIDQIVLLRLGGNPDSIVKSRIQETPQTLSELYRELFYSSTQEERSRLLKLVEWIVFAEQPFSLTELRFAIAIDPSLDSQYKSIQEYKDYGILIETDDEMERYVKYISRGLAEIQSHDNARFVQFIHQSVNDFIITDGLQILHGSSWQSIDLAIGQAHYRLSRSCIRCLDLVDNAFGEGSRMGSDFYIYTILNVPLIIYAVKFLVQHVKQSHDFGVHQIDLLEFTHWPSDRLILQWGDFLRWLSPFRYQRAGTILHLASEYGLVCVILAAIKSSYHDRTILDSKDYDNGRTPLSLAAENGNEAVVKMLLETGMVDVNSKDNESQTPLSLTAKNGHKAVVKILLETGIVDVNSKDNQSRTPLSLAVDNGQEAVVKMLLETGLVDVNSKDNKSRTPLSLAVGYGHEAVANILLKADLVDVDSKDKYGRTPLSLAVQNEEVAIVKILLDAGADFESRDNDGRTLLSLAVQNTEEDIVKILLDAGADFESKDNDGWTPLSRAVQFGRKEVVKILLDAGADFESKDILGTTPLGLAVQCGYEAVAKMLLEAGADLKSKNIHGETPLSLAVMYEHEAILKMMKSSSQYTK